MSKYHETFYGRHAHDESVDPTHLEVHAEMENALDDYAEVHQHFHVYGPYGGLLVPAPLDRQVHAAVARLAGALDGYTKAHQ